MKLKIAKMSSLLSLYCPICKKMLFNSQLSRVAAQIYSTNYKIKRQINRFLTAIDMIQFSAREIFGDQPKLAAGGRCGLIQTV